MCLMCHPPPKRYSLWGTYSYPRVHLVAFADLRPPRPAWVVATKNPDGPTRYHGFCFPPGPLRLAHVPDGRIGGNPANKPISLLPRPSVHTCTCRSNSITHARREVKLPLISDLLDLVDVESACRAQEVSRAARLSRARSLPGYSRPLGSSSSSSASSPPSSSGSCAPAPAAVASSSSSPSPPLRSDSTFGLQPRVRVVM